MNILILREPKRLLHDDQPVKALRQARYVGQAEPATGSGNGTAQERPTGGGKSGFVFELILRARRRLPGKDGVIA